MSESRLSPASLNNIRKMIPEPPVVSADDTKGYHDKLQEFLLDIKRNTVINGYTFRESDEFKNCGTDLSSQTKALESFIKSKLFNHDEELFNKHFKNMILRWNQLIFTSLKNTIQTCSGYFVNIGYANNVTMDQDGKLYLDHMIFNIKLGNPPSMKNLSSFDTQYQLPGLASARFQLTPERFELYTGDATNAILKDFYSLQEINCDRLDMKKIIANANKEEAKKLRKTLSNKNILPTLRELGNEILNLDMNAMGKNTVFIVDCIALANKIINDPENKLLWQAYCEIKKDFKEEFKDLDDLVKKLFSEVEKVMDKLMDEAKLIKSTRQLNQLITSIVSDANLNHHATLIELAQTQQLLTQNLTMLKSAITTPQLIIKYQSAIDLLETEKNKILLEQTITQLTQDFNLSSVHSAKQLLAELPHLTLSSDQLNVKIHEIRNQITNEIANFEQALKNLNELIKQSNANSYTHLAHEAIQTVLKLKTEKSIPLAALTEKLSNTLLALENANNQEKYLKKNNEILSNLNNALQNVSSSDIINIKAMISDTIKLHNQTSFPSLAMALLKIHFDLAFKQLNVAINENNIETKKRKVAKGCLVFLKSDTSPADVDKLQSDIQLLEKLKKKLDRENLALAIEHEYTPALKKLFNALQDSNKPFNKNDVLFALDLKITKLNHLDQIKTLVEMIKNLHHVIEQSNHKNIQECRQCLEKFSKMSLVESKEKNITNTPLRLFASSSSQQSMLAAECQKSLKNDTQEKSVLVDLEQAVKNILAIAEKSTLDPGQSTNRRS